MYRDYYCVYIRSGDNYAEIKSSKVMTTESKQ